MKVLPALLFSIRGEKYDNQHRKSADQKSDPASEEEQAASGTGNLYYRRNQNVPGSTDRPDNKDLCIIRATMGSIYRVPFCYAENMQAVMQKLKKCKIQTYAAYLEGSSVHDAQNYKEATAFLIGNEGNGLTRELAESADWRIRIPMCGKVESLNAGIASAILMYEAQRQRRN